jgi:GAF domain-containing protein
MASIYTVAKLVEILGKFSVCISCTSFRPMLFGSFQSGASGLTQSIAKDSCSMAAEGVIAQKKKAEEILKVSCSLILDNGSVIRPWPNHTKRGFVETHWDRIEELVGKCKGETTPEAFETEDKLFGFVLPVRTADSQEWYLTSSKTAESLDSINQLLLAVDTILSQQYTIEQQQIQLDASAMQISRTFEEQCWLRELTKHLGLCRSNNSAQQLAAEILQPLRSIVTCKQIAFVTAESKLTKQFDLASEIFGEGPWGVVDAEQLVAVHRDEVIWEPLIGNMRYTELPSGVISSYLIVPVGQVGNPQGFLVALERMPPAANNEVGFMYDPEFGSFEVGLMEEASALLSTQSHNIRLFAETQQLVLGTLRSMTRAIDARDSYTQGHSERVAKLGFELAQALDLPESSRQEIYLAGILHDIGKIGIPDHVLLKAGPLTDEEYETIKQHPVIGYRIIEQLSKLNFTLPGILHHHERWDGNGYPHKLKGEEIPLVARILAVADSFDAMTSSRPYRHHMPLERARKIISEGAGVQWDPDIVRVFLEWLDSKIPDTANAKDVSPLYDQSDSMWDSVASAVLSLSL